MLTKTIEEDHSIPINETNLKVVNKPALEGWTTYQHTQCHGWIQVDHDLKCNSTTNLCLNIVQKYPSCRWTLDANWTERFHSIAESKPEMLPQKHPRMDQNS